MERESMNASELVEKLYMVFDVESVGLHGEGFAVGWCVIGSDGKRIASAQYACDPDRAKGSDEDRKWIKENIPVPRQGYNCSAPRWVRAEFWRAWMYAKSQGAVLAADVPWPVEARFLAQCIDDEPGRKWNGPYLLIDIASARLAAGLDPLATVERNPEELPQHDPLCDARQSARLLIEALQKSAKSLRLAADMERLTHQAIEEFEVMSGGEVMMVAGDSIRLQKTGKVVTADHWHGEFRTTGEGHDIYTAARKAVEALEGGT